MAEVEGEEEIVEGGFSDFSYQVCIVEVCQLAANQAARLWRWWGFFPSLSFFFLVDKTSSHNCKTALQVLPFCRF